MHSRHFIKVNLGKYYLHSLIIASEMNVANEMMLAVVMRLVYVDETSNQR